MNMDWKSFALGGLAVFGGLGLLGGAVSAWGPTPTPTPVVGDFNNPAPTPLPWWHWYVTPTPEVYEFNSWLPTPTPTPVPRTFNDPWTPARDALVGELGESTVQLLENWLDEREGRR